MDAEYRPPRKRARVPFDRARWEPELIRIYGRQLIWDLTRVESEEDRRAIIRLHTGKPKVQRPKELWALCRTWTRDVAHIRDARRQLRAGQPEWKPACLRTSMAPRSYQIPRLIDPLDSVVEVSRNAKRQRDEAQRCYLVGDFDGASAASARKSTSYQLKDQSAAHMVRDGWLVHLEYHRFDHGWASLVSAPGRPEIRLHVPCAPPDPLPQNAESLGTEIPARDYGRIRVVDAEYTLREYLKHRGRVETYQWPARQRPFQHCYSCYERAWDPHLRECVNCSRGSYRRWDENDDWGDA